MTTARKRLIVLLALSALTAGVGAGAALYVLDSYLDPFDNRPFDQVSWAVNSPGSRMAMARAAVRRVPDGMPETDVVEVLGKPDFVEESRWLTGAAPAGAVRTYAYYLGSSSLSSLRGLDSAFVWVHVGSDGLVIAAAIGGG